MNEDRAQCLSPSTVRKHTKNKTPLNLMALTISKLKTQNVT